MYKRNQPTKAPFQLYTRLQRAATYHTRYEKSQLKQQALSQTTCKSSTSSSGDVVGAFSRGPKKNRCETRERNAPDASGRGAECGALGPAPPQPSPGGLGPSPPAPGTTLSASRPANLGGRGSHFHFTSGGSWLPQLPACREF